LSIYLKDSNRKRGGEIRGGGRAGGGGGGKGREGFSDRRARQLRAITNARIDTCTSKGLPDGAYLPYFTPPCSFIFLSSSSSSSSPSSPSSPSSSSSKYSSS